MSHRDEAHQGADDIPAAEGALVFDPTKFVPFLLSGTTPENLQLFFDGSPPTPGDAVELVCYAATSTSVSMKWRVVARAAMNTLEHAYDQHADDKVLVAEMLSAIDSVLIEVAGRERPYSVDSYLPPHLVDALQRVKNKAMEALK
jgi:hypothetical protein